MGDRRASVLELQIYSILERIYNFLPLCKGAKWEIIKETHVSAIKHTFSIVILRNYFVKLFCVLFAIVKFSTTFNFRTEFMHENNCEGNLQAVRWYFRFSTRRVQRLTNVMNVIPFVVQKKKYAKQLSEKYGLNSKRQKKPSMIGRSVGHLVKCLAAVRSNATQPLGK